MDANLGHPADVTVPNTMLLGLDSDHQSAAKAGRLDLQLILEYPDSLLTSMFASLGTQ
jgi:hypothetical protein